jgi:hypothetical protein
MPRSHKAARPIVSVTTTRIPEPMIRLSVAGHGQPDCLFEPDEADLATKAARDLAKRIGGTLRLAI